MGRLLTYYCSSCGFSLDAKEGNGFHYPNLYEKTKEKMINGQMGSDAKWFFEEHPDGAINVEYTMAQCKQCNNLENVLDLTMYVPKTGYIHEIDPKQKWSTAAPYYGKDYVIPYDLEKNWNQYKLFRVCWTTIKCP